MIVTLHDRANPLGLNQCNSGEFSPTTWNHRGTHNNSGTGEVWVYRAALRGCLGLNADIKRNERGSRFAVGPNGDSRFRQETAHGAGQTKGRVGRFAKFAHHRGCTLQRIVIERPATEGHTAGKSEITIERKPDFSRLNFNCRREAAVEINGTKFIN